MSDHGESLLPPFPFGELPNLPDPIGEEATWPNELPPETDSPTLSAASDGLPDWLANAALPAESLDSSDVADLPNLFAAASVARTEQPSHVLAALLGSDRDVLAKSDDTLADYPLPAADDLPVVERKQTAALPFDDQSAITERIGPKSFAQFHNDESDDELPLPPPFDADLSSLSPFGSPSVPDSSVANVPEDIDTNRVETSLTRTPPPADPLDIAPVTAIWRSRKVSITPTFEENNTVAVYRTVIRDEGGRGFLNCKASFPLPAGLKQVQASRKPMAKKGQLHWNIGPLDPGEAIPLSVKLPVALLGHELASLPRSFEILYQPPPGARLVGEVTSPTSVPIEDAFSVVVRVGNVGELTTDRIAVRIANRTHALPAVKGSIARLRPGDSSELKLELSTVHPGRQDWLVTLESAGAEAVESVFSTEAIPSRLSIVLQHDSMMRVDAETTITAVVCNDSATRARGVTAMLTVPEELIFASSPNGEYDRSLNLVGWLIGDLEPGQSRTVTAVLRGFAPGLVGLQARVEGMSGTPVTTASNVFVEIDARSTSSSLDKLLAAMQEAVPDDAVSNRRDTWTDVGSRYMIFVLSGTQYAVRIENIREVIRPTRITPVPGMPDWLPGVANIRGDILSIVDVPRFLQVEDGENRHRGLLIAQTDDGQMSIGLLVNDIVGIRRLPPGQSIDPELMEDNPIAAYLDSIAELEGKLVPILDLNVLFSSAELNCFQPV